MLNQNLLARGGCRLPTLCPVHLSEMHHERLPVFVYRRKANCRGAKTK